MFYSRHISDWKLANATYCFWCSKNVIFFLNRIFVILDISQYFMFIFHKSLFQDTGYMKFLSSICKPYLNCLMSLAEYAIIHFDVVWCTNIFLHNFVANWTWKMFQKNISYVSLNCLIFMRSVIVERVKVLKLTERCRKNQRTRIH